MENVTLLKLMQTINALNLEEKLEILSKLTNSLKLDFKQSKPANDKEILSEELFGVWKDLPGNLEEEIINSRSISNRVIDLD